MSEEFEVVGRPPEDGPGRDKYDAAVRRAKQLCAAAHALPAADVPCAAHIRQADREAGLTGDESP